MRHHAIVVTSHSRDVLEYVRRKSVVIAENHKDAFDRNPFDITPITAPASNDYASFLIAPDGSKEYFPQSQAGDAARKEIKELLRVTHSLDWVEIHFGQADQFPDESLPRYGEVIDGRGYYTVDETTRILSYPSRPSRGKEWPTP